MDGDDRQIPPALPATPVTPALPGGPVTPALPGGPVTPVLPGGLPSADDESPTQEIWRGSAAVPEGGARQRRFPWRRGAARDTSDTLDLPPVEALPPPPPTHRTQVLPGPVPVPAPPGPRGYPAYPPQYAYPPQNPHQYPHPPQYAYPSQNRYPPGYPPAGYPPPPPPPRRRRRKWPWVMLFFLAATVACCGGIFTWARPYVDEYPASIVASADVPGLRASTDAARRRAADELLNLISSDQIDEDAASLLWTDTRQRVVTLLVTTRFVQHPEDDLAGRFTDLTPRLKLTNITTVEPGPLGGHLRCAAGSSGGKSATVCGWADHGSLGVGVFAGRSQTEAADLLRTIRASVVKRT